MGVERGMAVNQIKLQGRDFLTVFDFTAEELGQVLELAHRLKAEYKAGRVRPLLAGRSLAMLFRKTSTRTRVSFEAGMWQLGGYAIFLSAAESQLGIGETIRDTGLVLSRYVDGIMIRTFDQGEVEELARWAEVPVINGLTDLHHPCQALADYFTLQEHKGRLAGLRLAFIGDGNNVCHSLLQGAARLGVHFVAATPAGYEPRPEIVAEARREAERTGGSIEVVRDPREAARGADALYTDTWVSMGQERDAERRKRDFAGYQVNGELLRLADPEAVVMHCLPAHYGQEITEEVAYGPHSAIFDQAENRLHVQKALLVLLLGESEAVPAERGA